VALDNDRLLTSVKSELVSFLETNLNASPYSSHWTNVGGTVAILPRSRMLYHQIANGHQLSQPHVAIEKSGGTADRTQIGSGEFVYAGEYHELEFTLSVLTTEACGGDATCNDVSSALMGLFAQGGAGRDLLVAEDIDVVDFDSGVEIADDELPDLVRNDHRLTVRAFLQTTNVLAAQSVVLATVVMTAPDTATVTLGSTLTQAVAEFRIRLLTGTTTAETQVHATTKKDDDSTGSATGLIPRARSANTVVSMSMSTGDHKQVTGVTMTGGIAGEQWVIESIPEPVT